MKSFVTKELNNGFLLNKLFENIPLSVNLSLCNDSSEIRIKSDPLPNDIYEMCIKELGDLIQEDSISEWGNVTAVDGLHVRKDGNINSEIVNILDYRESVHIIGENKEWYEIDKPYIGWVYKLYIDLSNENLGLLWGRTIAESGLNIRSNGNISASKVGVLDYGQRFHIVGENTLWYNIDEPCSGWIYKEYTKREYTPRTISQSLLEFTKSWEGFSATPYRDAGGNWTIGYGICSYRERPNYTITEEAASKQLEDTLNNIASDIYSFLSSYDLTQSQLDSLVDFSYNLGIGSLKRSTLLKNIKECKDNMTIVDDFVEWSYCGDVKLEGLIRRREAEAKMWLYNEYNNN